MSDTHFKYETIKTDGKKVSLSAQQFPVLPYQILNCMIVADKMTLGQGQ